MRVRFWGTRGSLPVPGPATVRYGGNTSCVEVESRGGTLVVLDCGTGVRGLGQALAERGGAPDAGAILISHTHWDHIQGFPFFAPLFAPGREWDVYGPRGLGESLRDTLAGQMQYRYFPITLDAMGAQIRYHSLVEGDFQVGDIRIRTRFLNHPVLTLAYRLEVDGATLVYASDQEPYRKSAASGDEALKGKDREHADFAAGADLLIHDAQYTAGEYAERVGWGHSTVEYALRVALEGGVKRLALTHHDPTRSDDELDPVVDGLREKARRLGFDGEVMGAAEGMEVALEGNAEGRAEAVVGGARAAQAESALRQDRAIAGHRMVLALPPSREADILRTVAVEDGVEVRQAPVDAAVSPSAPGDDAAADRPAPSFGDPSLIIVPGDDAGLEAARRLAGNGSSDSHDVTVVAVADEVGDADPVDDWLVRPFSPEYARTRIRGWLLGTPVRWARVPRTEDEGARLDSLRRLGILDTGAEERFDRITRLAAAVLGVPVSLVTLIDEERQWFKSAEGVDLDGTTRDAAFCAHTIQGDELLVVHDATSDDRFADNPLVAGPTHMRFYAGYPLRAPDGHRVGSLCVIDLKARDFSERDQKLLEDLAHLAEEELARTAE